MRIYGSRRAHKSGPSQWRQLGPLCSGTAGGYRPERINNPVPCYKFLNDSCAN